MPKLSRSQLQLIADLEARNRTQVGMLPPNTFSPGSMAQAPQQVPANYLPRPISMNQQIPQGLGSDVFRSVLAPLQSPNYGLGQIDPRFLTSIQPLKGGDTSQIPYMQGMQ